MRRCAMAWLFAPALTFALAALVPPAAMPAEEKAPTLETDVQPIFETACTKCHGPKKAKAKLDLSATAGVAALVNRPADQVPELMLVKPGDPANSYLWQKLQHTSAKGKGMPRGIFRASRLPEDQLELIRKWIEAGAPE
jgi:cytochrome c553